MDGDVLGSLAAGGPDVIDKRPQDYPLEPGVDGMSMRMAARTAVFALLALLLTTGVGIRPSEAQTSDQIQVQTDRSETETVPSEVAEPLSPAAEDSGWLDLGTWSIIALVIVVALVVWLAFFRPRARPEQHRRR